MNKKRLAFRCWNCGKPFERDVELPAINDPAAILLVKCAACGAKCSANLNDYQQGTVERFKGIDANASSEWIFPDELKTEKP